MPGDHANLTRKALVNRNSTRVGKEGAAGAQVRSEMAAIGRVHLTPLHQPKSRTNAKEPRCIALRRFAILAGRRSSTSPAAYLTQCFAYFIAFVKGICQKSFFNYKCMKAISNIRP
jgi:hypothetical protein